MYQQLLKHVEPLDPIECGKLKVTPLRWDPARVPAEGECPWLAAREAFERGLLAPARAAGEDRIVGSWVRNRSDRPVLVPDGDTLPGAEKAGEVDLSVLVPPGGSVRLPLAQPERRFWRQHENAFRWRKVVERREPLPPEIICATPFFELGLDEDWERYEPAHILQRMRVFLDSVHEDPDSALERLRDIGLFELWRSDLPCLQRLHASPAPGQAGVVLAFEGQVLAMELFGHPELYRPYHARALRSREIWARQSSDPIAWSDRVREPEELLARLGRGLAAPVGGDGLGTLWRIDGPVIGMALIHEDHLVHLVAFHVPDRDAKWLS